MSEPGQKHFAIGALVEQNALTTARFAVPVAQYPLGIGGLRVPLFAAKLRGTAVEQAGEFITTVAKTGAVFTSGIPVQQGTITRGELDADAPPAPANNLPGIEALAKDGAGGTDDVANIEHLAGQRAVPIQSAEHVGEFRVDQRQLWWQSQGSAQWHGLALDSGAQLRRATPAAATEATLWCWTLNAGVMYAIFSDGVLYRHGIEDATWQSMGALPGGAVMSMAVHADTDRLVLTRTDRIAVDLYRVPAAL